MLGETVDGHDLDVLQVGDYWLLFWYLWAVLGGGLVGMLWG